jgi:hypothetical protein
MVAWSSGKVAAAERRTAISEAIRGGVRKGSPAAALVDRWLDRKPPLMIVDAYKRYIHAEFGKLSVEQREEQVHQLTEAMSAVAMAAGGRFGFGKVSAKEHHMMEMMNRILRE